MVAALVAALSACGLTAAWALLHTLRTARDVELQAEPDDVEFGFDTIGFG